MGKWVFPAMTIGAGEYLLVWASGKDRASAVAPLHTNFRFAADGEYLGLVNKEGAGVAEYAPTYLAQQPDISYGTDAVDPETLGYFPTPSPGEPNLPGGPGFAPTPVVSLAGFGVGATRFETNHCRVESTPFRLLVDLLEGIGRVGWFAGEDFTEDRTQAEDVGMLIEMIDFATSLFRGHIRWRAEDRSGK